MKSRREFLPTMYVSLLIYYQIGENFGKQKNVVIGADLVIFLCKIELKLL